MYISDIFTGGKSESETWAGVRFPVAGNHFSYISEFVRTFNWRVFAVHATMERSASVVNC